MADDNAADQFGYGTTYTSVTWGNYTIIGWDTTQTYCLVQFTSGAYSGQQNYIPINQIGVI